MEQPTVGGWTQAYCTTCKTIREHIVVAMVGKRPAKVECTSCHKQHQFRADAPGVKPAKATKAPSAAARKRAAEAEPTAPEVDLEARTSDKPRLKYDPQRRYALDDVIEHPTFGVGVVLALPGAQRIEIYFPSGRKVLLHDRGSAREGLLRPPPRDESAGPNVSDAPPKPRGL